MAPSRAPYTLRHGNVIIHCEDEARLEGALMVVLKHMDNKQSPKEFARYEELKSRGSIANTKAAMRKAGLPALANYVSRASTARHFLAHPRPDLDEQVDSFTAQASSPVASPPTLLTAPSTPTSVWRPLPTPIQLADLIPEFPFKQAPREVTTLNLQACPFTPVAERAAAFARTDDMRDIEFHECDEFAEFQEKEKENTFATLPESCEPPTRAVPRQVQQEVSDKDEASDFDAFLAEVDAAAEEDKKKDKKKSKKKAKKKDLTSLEVELFGSDYDYDEDGDDLQPRDKQVSVPEPGPTAAQPPALSNLLKMCGECGEQTMHCGRCLMCMICTCVCSDSGPSSLSSHVQGGNGPSHARGKPSSDGPSQLLVTGLPDSYSYNKIRQWFYDQWPAIKDHCDIEAKDGVPTAKLTFDNTGRCVQFLQSFREASPQISATRGRIYKPTIRALAGPAWTPNA